jgi:hypothetical protein
MFCESQEFLPGQVGVVITALKRGTRLSGIYMDPPTAATFTIERFDELPPREMLSLAMINAPGVRLIVRNDGPRPARFRAQIECAADVDALERDLERIVERDWAAAYDRASGNGDSR